MKGAFSEAMDNLGALDKQILVERHLISREHAAKSSGSGLVLNREESFCVMINEEDHLQRQALRPGWTMGAIDHLDSELEKKLDYAFDNELATRRPARRISAPASASTMLHLPGLVLGEQINPIIQSVNKLGLAVRGLYGEGTEALGNVFQVPTSTTARRKRKRRLSSGWKKFWRKSSSTRRTRGRRCWKKSRRWVFNHIGRAYGIMANAHSISSKETMNLLSLMRLGVDMDRFRARSGRWWTSCSF